MLTSLSAGADVRQAIPWILVLSAVGLVAAGKPRTPELRLQNREVKAYGLHSHTIELFIVDQEAALHVHLPGANGCEPGVQSPVGGETFVALYRGKEVRNVIPWGAARPPLLATHSLEKASSGVIECTAIQGPKGEPAVRVTLKDLRFPNSRLAPVSPVDATLVTRPP